MPVAALHLPEPLTASSRLLASVPSGAQAGGWGHREEWARLPQHGARAGAAGGGVAGAGRDLCAPPGTFTQRLIYSETGSAFRTECGHLPVRYGVTWARAGERRDLRSSAEPGICEDSCVPHAWTPSTSKALC